MVMKPEVKDRIMSHEHPVTAAIYNSKFNQVPTLSLFCKDEIISMSRTSDKEKHLSQDSNLWIPGFEPRQHYWGEGLSPWHHIFSLAPSFFLGVSSVWKQSRLRAIKVYRAMDHGNVKRWCKGRWQGWAFFLFTFPMSLARNQNRSSLSWLRIR